jgi:uncharacterized protein YdeI (YjbR/CyaY-like superfamily)
VRSVDEWRAWIEAHHESVSEVWRHFEALSLVQRRLYFAWIDSAKREETKLRRLQEAIGLLAKGQRLGLK